MKEVTQDTCKKCELYKPRKGKRRSPRCRANCILHPDDCPLYDKTMEKGSICDYCPNRYDDVCGSCQHTEF